MTRSLTENTVLEQSTLGRRLDIPKYATVEVCAAGLSQTFFTPSYQVIIGIGKDNVAYLTMDEDAYNAFIKGATLIF